MIQFIAVQ